MKTKIKPMIPETAGYGFMPGLNGLRAFSVLIVLIAHMGFDHIVPGGFGVTMFFFISGFLITRLLLAETEKAGKVNLPKFYIRRLIRLYPALLFMVFGTVALYLGFGYGRPEPMELAAAIFYFTNFYQVTMLNAGTAPFMPWTPLWSLAVEEHFYLAFPILVLLFGKNFKRLAAALIAVIIGAALWRSFIVFGTDIPPYPYTYMMTDARIDSLAWGCLLSVLLHIKGSAQAFNRLIGALPFLLAILGLLASFVIRDESFRYTLRFSVQGLSIFILMLNLYFWKRLSFAFKILDFKPVAWIGMISYPLYLWHFPIIDLFDRSLGESALNHVLAIALSFSVAAISFYWIETPFLALRRRFGSHAGTAMPASTHIGIARLRQFSKVKQ